MSLTPEGYYHRKWGKFPELGKLLGKKRLSDHWFGRTSASDNIFDQISRFHDISALVQDNEVEIKKAVIDIGDPIRRELIELSQTLKWVSEHFARASKLSFRLGNYSKPIRQKRNR